MITLYKDEEPLEVEGYEISVIIQIDNEAKTQRTTGNEKEGKE